MNENKETEKLASIKSEATIKQEDIINKIAEETDVSKDDIENILNVMAKVIENDVTILFNGVKNNGGFELRKAKD
jgi:nucleoid DNA-binding protein